MGRMRVMLAALFLGAGIFGLAPPAHASETVTIDVAYAAAGETTCTPFVMYPTCTTPYTGHGITGTHRAWAIAVTQRSFRSCPGGYTGTWVITATDGSGDGLSGTFFRYPDEALHMTVTGGSGHYAGYTNSAPGGTMQNFGPISFVNPVPSVPWPFGCTGWDIVVTDAVWAGSLRFEVQPA